MIDDFSCTLKKKVGDYCSVTITEKFLMKIPNNTLPDPGIETRRLTRQFINTSVVQELMTI